MQNAMQANANYDQHNAWYNNIFATEIKTEPGTSPISQHVTSPPASNPTTPQSQLEQYLKLHHQQNINAAMNATVALTPSPHTNNDLQHFFDAKMQHQIYQQQQYQQQFRQAQQAAAQNQISSAAVAAHLPLGFNPLTPPGLPMATLPHFYNNNNIGNSQQTPSPQPDSTQLQLSAPMDINSYEKLQSALTPRNTPPMESQTNKEMNPPTTQQMQQLNNMQMQQQEQSPPEEKHDVEKVQEINSNSNSSEDVINLKDEAKYYESILNPRYNSHGKLRTYPCKSCPKLYDTKAAYWEHLLTHIKPEKILRCPMYPKCPFVTEYKHFLDFHLKKHRKQKPFKCPEGGCKYSCETKGMLTSHLKSHSDLNPFKCADCDYDSKFLHSLKQHLRKYDHRPGVVLDDKGNPNPAVVIDVYGRRRGPKSKGSATSSKKRDRSVSQNKSGPCTSQLSAALQGIKMVQQVKQQLKEQQQLQQQQQQQLQEQQQQHLQEQQQEQQKYVPPEESNSCTTTELPTPQNQQNETQQNIHLSNLQQQHQNLSNLLPPLATILQQNTNMAFFPYWNLNLHLLAAQQQAVVLAQLSPRKRELALQELRNQRQKLDNEQQESHPDEESHNNDDNGEHKLGDSAMDLSHSPEEEEQRTPQNPNTNVKKINKELTTLETPIGGSMKPSRRKGRVLKLDTLLQVQTANHLAEEKSKSSEVSTVAIVAAINKLTGHCSSEDSSEENVHEKTPGIASTMTASTTSNDSGTATSSECESETTSASKPTGAVHECKYCDIYFKDPVLYTIHMGYHSCDDAFKCNMCGEKCDGAVGLFVHMARNAHA